MTDAATNDGHRSPVSVAEVGRDFVLVSGPDAIEWLQGQLSQDVAELTEGGSAWSFLLQPQGKVDALVRVTRSAAGVVLDTDAGWGEHVAARLKRFKLRVKAELQPIDWRCLALRGGDGGLAAGPLGDDVVVEPAWRPGVDIIGPAPARPPGVEFVSAEDYEAMRIEAGFPKMGAELDESTIPAESGFVSRAVSFTKGCYTGQELVARIDSRGGNVPRHLRRLVFDEPGRQPPAGAGVTVDGKVVGSVTSAATSAAGADVALGYVARAVSPPAACEFVWEGGRRPGRVESLPEWP